MIILLAILGGIVVGVIAGVIIGMAIKDEKRGGVDAANAARKAHVQEAQQKVLALFDTKTEITNDDVQHALGVSDSAATEYLSALEAQGRIRQVGEAGRPVHYVKINA